jgi:hypothetical protein
MRSPWQYLLFAVPVLIIAISVSLVTHKKSTLDARTPASVVPADEPGQLHELKTRITKKIQKLEEDEDVPEEDLRVASPTQAAVIGPSLTEPPQVVAVDLKDRNREPAASGECVTEEFPGRSPETAQISKTGWDAVMEEFHGAKTQLAAWLDAHKSRFSEKTYQWMGKRIADARLQRPPSSDEPDLSWRGTGSVSAMSDQTLLIRVGAGFEKWVSEKPQRARFELARLLAQAWAPCEMAKVDSSAPWKDFVSCMDLVNEADPAKACGKSTVSEAGWAVSSAIAAQATPPGCKIPAFNRAPASECLKKIGVEL